MKPAPQSIVLLAGHPSRAPNLERFLTFARALPADKSWRLEASEHKETRSSAQNRYLWGVCYATVAKSTGQPAEDWHEFFLGEKWGWERVQMMGRTKLKPIRRSSRLSRAEFAEFVDFIHQRAAENGIFIPSPNEYDFGDEHRAAA